jgi:CRP/FNR family cyclic AMP-dependent transcriptional regulator
MSVSAAASPRTVHRDPLVFEAFMRDHRLFAGASNDIIRACAPAFVQREFRKRSVLFDQGDFVNGLFLIRSGKIRTGRVTTDGCDYTLDILGANDLVGEDAILESDSRRSTRATVISDVVAYYVPRRVLFRVISSSPVIAINIGRVVQERRNDIVATLEDLQLRRVPERILRLLRRLARSHGVFEPAGLRIDVRLTHAQLASLIGSTRETVSLELGNLAREHRLFVDHGFYVLPMRDTTAQSGPEADLTPEGFPAGRRSSSTLVSIEQHRKRNSQRAENTAAVETLLG